MRSASHREKARHLAQVSAAKHANDRATFGTGRDPRLGSSDRRCDPDAKAEERMGTRKARGRPVPTCAEPGHKIGSCVRPRNAGPAC